MTNSQRPSGTHRLLKQDENICTGTHTIPKQDRQAQGKPKGTHCPLHQNDQRGQQTPTPPSTTHFFFVNRNNQQQQNHPNSIENYHHNKQLDR
jgi:hypothetical protein